MVEKITPKKNEVVFISRHSMLHIMEGTGAVEIDFKPFSNWQEKLIFLERGQYIKFLSGDFVVRRIDFSDDAIHEDKDFRVLFKHLLSTGYINFDDCSACQQYLESSILTSPNQILDITSKQWFWQNPFQANENEYHLIFDVKDVVDQEYKNHLGTLEIISLLDDFDLNPQKIYTEKIGITIKMLQARKVLSESQKEIAFSDKSIKEIAYENGFKDPAYFNRFFRSKTGITPATFRENQHFQGQDFFLEDIYALISRHHEKQHKVGFYADEMNLSIQALSQRIRDKLNVSIGQLIRLQIIRTAKKYLEEGRTIKDISRLLHFEEPNHFSSFFKHYSGETPTSFLSKKVP